MAVCDQLLSGFRLATSPISQRGPSNILEQSCALQALNAAQKSADTQANGLTGPNGAANVYLSGETFDGNHTESCESAANMLFNSLSSAQYKTWKSQQPHTVTHARQSTIRNSCAGGYGLPNSIPNDPSKTTAADPQTNTKVCPGQQDAAC